MKIQPVIRYLKLNWRRHWKMELFTVLQLCLVALLVTLIVTSNIKFSSFAWMKQHDDLSYVGSIYDKELFKYIQPEDILAQASTRHVADGRQMDKSQTNRHLGLTVVLDYEMAKYVRFPLSRGAWFEPGKGNQVLIGYSLRNRYQLGKTYTFVFNHLDYDPDYEERVEAKVVGYLTSENYTLRTTEVDPSNFAEIATKQKNLMFCMESVAPEELGDNKIYSCLVRTPENPTGDEDISRGFPSLKRSYEYEIERNQEQLVLFTYLIVAICVVSIITVSSNLIVNGDKAKRMRAIAVLCGESKKSILLAEVMKRLFELVIAVLLAFIVTFIVDACSPGTIMIPRCCWYGVLVVSVISLAMGLLEWYTVRRLQPLDVLRRD